MLIFSLNANTNLSRNGMLMLILKLIPHSILISMVTNVKFKVKFMLMLLLLLMLMLMLTLIIF